jgi:hypothetical protein
MYHLGRFITRCIAGRIAAQACPGARCCCHTVVVRSTKYYLPAGEPSAPLSSLRHRGGRHTHTASCRQHRRAVRGRGHQALDDCKRQPFQQRRHRPRRRPARGGGGKRHRGCSHEIVIVRSIVKQGGAVVDWPGLQASGQTGAAAASRPTAQCQQLNRKLKLAGDTCGVACEAAAGQRQQEQRHQQQDSGSRSSGTSSRSRGSKSSSRVAAAPTCAIGRPLKSRQPPPMQ